jgi:capsular polysaccharide biosynthesis protein
MSTSHYVRRILSRWRIIAAVTAVLLAAAAVLTWTTPTTYTSTSQLYVANLSEQGDMASVQAAGVYAQGRMLSYAAVAGSQAMADRLSDDLGSEALEDTEIRTEVPYATVLINLTVTAPTAEGAHDVAQAVADNYNDLLTEVEGVQETGLRVGVSTVNPPTTPDSPSSPKVTLNLLAGLLAGLLLGVAVAAVRDLLDDRVREDEDLGAPVLGRLPALAGEAALALGDTSPLAEAVRRARVHLEASPHRTWLVSAVDGADATTVGTLLAQSLEQAGRDSVLVDADLRDPRVAERLGLPREPGLTTVVAGMASLAEALVTTDGGMRVLPAGEPVLTPNEVVGSAGMSRLLGELAREHGTVLVVTPPVLEVADAAALAHRVDAVLLVVRHGRTRRKDLARALEELGRDPGTGVRLVVTDVRSGTKVGTRAGARTGASADHHRA